MVHNFDVFAHARSPVCSLAHHVYHMYGREHIELLFVYEQHIFKLLRLELVRFRGIVFANTI